MKTKPKILIISGPTGSGETTLTNLLIEKYPQFCRFITTTSRAPRDNEQNGVDYYFISQAKFERKIKNNELLEYTHVKNRDQYYGTSREELNRIISLGKIPVLNVDIVGTRFFAKLFQTVSIFVAPESVEILGERLRSRNPDIFEAEFSKRLDNARAELTREMPFYKYKVTNRQGEVAKALEKIEEILKKEIYI